MDLNLLSLVALALAFDFLNGFHDAANSIATVVSTRVLSPRQAVVWAAFFNFVAFLVFQLNVASTVGKGIIDPAIVDRNVIAATLIAACIWDLITWYQGLPTSSSHALIGVLIGSVVAKVVASGLVWVGVINTVVLIVLAPILVLGLGFILVIV